MRLVLALVLAAGVVAGAVALLARGDRHGATPPHTPTRQPDVAGPRVSRPHGAASLAAALTATTRRLDRALGAWSGSGAVPPGVAALAARQQRLVGLMVTRRRLGDAALALLPDDVRAFARATVAGRRSLAAIPRSPGRAPPIRLVAAAPAAALRSDYLAAQRRFGVPWSILASINFVESAFGRIRSASEAGARGPMQFLPATWREYGMGGDIRRPRDAILAAANYLRHNGAPAQIGRALFAYNHSTDYVRAIRAFARRMDADRRAFLSYYAWPVLMH